MNKDETKPVSSTMIEFVRNNVLSVTELTRTKKLTEILDGFSNQKSEEIYLVQNNRNKAGLGALIDVELLEELLFIREAVEQSIDDAVESQAAERVGTFHANISMAKALHLAGIEDIEIDHIKQLSDELEL